MYLEFYLILDILLIPFTVLRRATTTIKGHNYPIINFNISNLAAQMSSKVIAIWADFKNIYYVSNKYRGPRTK